MKFRVCQYIEGEPSLDDACKCGAETDGGPYCAAHKDRCVTRRLAEVAA